MIARIRILLPFYFSWRLGDQLSPYEYVSGQYTVKIYPPYQTGLDLTAISRGIAGLAVPARDALEHLKPIANPQQTNLVTLDGNPTISANLLQIDFKKPDFDRRKVKTNRPEDLEKIGDPSIEYCFKVAKDFLARIRTITRGTKIREISPSSTAWRLDYLTDDEKDLPLEQGKYRRRLASSFNIGVQGISSAVWNRVTSLPDDYTPHVWDTLLLDAEAFLPEVGTSLLVAFAALETFISWALDQFAQQTRVKAELWAWINERENWLKEPSVTEQYDQLLRVLSGVSLKEKSELWEAFTHLKKFRDSFIHEGKLELGGKRVTVQEAYNLVGRVKEIIDWVEQLLPSSLHRPKLGTTANLQIFKVLSGEGPATDLEQ